MMCVYCRRDTDEIKHWEAIFKIREWWVSRTFGDWISIHDLAADLETIFTKKEP